MSNLFGKICWNMSDPWPEEAKEIEEACRNQDVILLKQGVYKIIKFSTTFEPPMAELEYEAERVNK